VNFKLHENELKQTSVNEIAKNTGIEKKVTVQKTVEAFMETVKDSIG